MENKSNESGDTFGEIGLGVSLIYWGITLLLNPIHYSAKYQLVIDYSVTGLILGLLLILGGSTFIYTVMRHKHRQHKGKFWIAFDIAIIALFIYFFIFLL